MGDSTVFWLLASSSPYRNKVLQQIGIPFRSIAAGLAEETIGVRESPERRVEILAQTKAETLLPFALEYDEACVLGMDTMVMHRGTMLGKPIDAQEAARTLASLQGQQHSIMTGYACLHCKAGRLIAQQVCHLTTKVIFRALSPAWQAWYIETGEWRGKSGGYALQGLGSVLVQEIQGDIANGSGLSVSVLVNLCRSMHIELEPRSEIVR